MKAWLLESYRGLDGLRLGEIVTPIPGVGEALLQVRFAALNPADRYLAEKLYPARPALPHILGRDGMGTVAAVGPGVSDLRAGDKRLLFRSPVGVERPGTLAEFVVVPADALATIPPGWSDEQAAGASTVYLTAYQALTQWGQLPPGVVLITGASGGVGVASLQLARALGHRVVVLSRSEAKRAELLRMGATLAFDPQRPNWVQQLKSQLPAAGAASDRVDLAIDNIGGHGFSDLIDTLGMNGKVSLVGRLAGPVPEFNTATLFFRRLRLGGVAVGAYTLAESRQAWQHILDLMTQTGDQPLVDQIFPFDQLLQAFDRLHQGPMGKVLVRVP